MSALVGARAIVFAAAFMGMWLWVMVQVQPLSREWDAALPLWLTAPGVALGAAGIAGILVGVALFIVKGHGTPAVFDAPQQFVAVGPYRYVRNPMYLSVLAWFVGFALAVRSLVVLMFAAAWFLMVHAFVLFYEEPGLRRRFGRTYIDYCERVPRWVPHGRAPRDPRRQPSRGE
jgi:protein-S-isoprenylcysteine O-methyltransferase Ste14